MDKDIALLLKQLDEISLKTHEEAYATEYELIFIRPGEVFDKASMKLALRRAPGPSPVLSTVELGLSRRTVVDPIVKQQSGDPGTSGGTRRKSHHEVLHKAVVAI